MLRPSRLTMARRCKGWNKARLADEVGVSSRSITKYEMGHASPSEETLNRIADRLGFPVDFFTGSDLELISDSAASFRALTRMSASQRDRALAAGNLAVELSAWIDTRYKLPLPSIPQIDTSDPEEAAEIVRAEWGLAVKPISNVVHLLESHGVRVFSLGRLGREVGAFSFWRGTQPFVLLNTFDKSPERCRFDGCHELGHLVMHREGEKGRDAERQADRFASAFLMPRASVLAAGIRNPNLRTLILRKRKWGVSTLALIRRLHEVGLLSDWHYRELNIEAASRGLRTYEADSVPGEYSQSLQIVLDHCRQVGISRSQIASDLGLTPSHLDLLLEGLVIMAISDNEVDRETRTPRPSGHLRLVQA